MKGFRKATRFFGVDSEPEELKRWVIEDEEEAKKELEKYNCEYAEYPECWGIKEYALEYCKCDKGGDFVEGSDYELAAE